MTCPSHRAIAIHRTLEAMFSDPRTWGYFGNNATAAEQTIEAATPLTRDPFARDLSESFAQPVPDVEDRRGRAV